MSDMTDDAGPLADLRVVAVEQFGAGPFGTLLLADLGAEVIKIEDPAAGGDVGRSVPPGAADGSSLYFEAFNRGKRSIALDLTTDAGREVLHRLVTTADAVYNNLRGDLPERLGLTYAALAEWNPAIVCVSLSAYGRVGERRAEPGYDAVSPWPITPPGWWPHAVCWRGSTRHAAPAAGAILRPRYSTRRWRC
jgi:crotonobetainyl-CoA:carnitine CoA-transferase CaiB-like acyl-CoA transferase